MSEDRTSESDSEHPSASLPSETAPAKQRNVFISYRVHPDQPVAAATKRLIEANITPAPNVFVSGLGGLKPSALGFKSQIQHAVLNADAFVAIVTPDSKEREWIFYEAGAAWGRQALYAPLVFGVQPGELPSSIADYQAYDIRNREAMERFIVGLAEHLGAEVRTHFGQRYAAFLRQLEQQKDAASATTDDPEGNEGPIFDAFLSNNIELAEELLSAAEEEARAKSELESLAHLQVIRILFHPKTKRRSQQLDAFDKMASDVKNTGTYCFWRGRADPSVHEGIKLLRRAYSLAPPQLWLPLVAESLAIRLLNHRA